MNNSNQVKIRIEEIKSKVVPILSNANIPKIGLFGSVLTDRYSPESDIDILVDLDKGFDFKNIISIHNLLEDKLGRKVELTQYSRIKPSLRQYILPTEVRIYDENN